MTDGCTYGKVTRTMVENLKYDIQEIKDTTKNLSNHYSQRLPAWGTILISVLVGMIGTLAGVAFSK
jgi:hypothetical protein